MHNFLAGQVLHVRLFVNIPVGEINMKTRALYEHGLFQ